MKVFAKASWFRNLNTGDAEVGLEHALDTTFYSHNDDEVAALRGRLDQHDKVLILLLTRAADKGVLSVEDIQGILEKHVYRVEA